MHRLAESLTKKIGENMRYKRKPVIRDVVDALKGDAAYTVQRENVCVARVVGQKVIPEVREPAKTIEIPEKITPEHTEDIIEWDCGEPLLAPKPEGVPA